MNLEKLKAGLRYCLKEHRSHFMPTPAEFRDYCNEAWRGIKPKIEPDENLKKLEYDTESVPMPDNFKKLLKQYVEHISVS